MTQITCGTHGKQEETFVCRHIIETVKDGEPRGFHWNRTEEGFEAICSECNELSEKAFASQVEDLIRPLCFGCFQDAASINGIEIV